MTNLNNEKRYSNDFVVGIVNLKDVKLIVQRIFDDSSLKVLDYSLITVNNKKFEFTGSQKQLKITIQKKSSQSSMSLFVKFIPQNPEIRQINYFNEELDFFNKVLPWLGDCYRGEKWSPVCYLIKNDALVMEDLRSQGYKSRSQILDEINFLKSALSTIARFHSCSILAESELKRLSENFVTLQECYPNSFVEKQFTRNDEKAHRRMIVYAKSTAAIAGKIGLDSQIVFDAFKRSFSLLRPSKKYCNVICHGNLNAKHILFDDTKPIPKSVLVDFQMIKYAPQVLDVLQLLYLHTTRLFREKNEKALIEFYQSILEKNVRYNDTTKKIKVATVDAVVEAYKDLRLYGSLMTNMYNQAEFFDPEIISNELESNHKKLEDYIFCKKNSIENYQVLKKKVLDDVMELIEVAKCL